MSEKKIYIISGFTSAFQDRTWTSPLLNINGEFVIHNLPYFSGKSNKSMKYFKHNTSLENKFFINLKKVFHLLKEEVINTNLIVGVYEIPHGLIALFIGKIKGIPSCINFIGNPDYSKVRRGFRKMFTVFLLKNVDYVTVCGRNSKSVLMDWGVRENNIYVLPNSADPNVFFKKNTKKKYDILFLGRLAKVKKLELLIEIVRRLKELMPEIRLAIGGSGPEKKKLELLTKSNNLQSNIYFLGHMQMESLNGFYNSGRVFALTSETEGLPRTVVEAMACGIPCIVPDIGDLSDLVINNVSSVMINDNKNLDSYVSQIFKLLNDKEYYENMSIKCLRHINKNYSQASATQVWSRIIGNA